MSSRISHIPEVQTRLSDETLSAIKTNYGVNVSTCFFVIALFVLIVVYIAVWAPDTKKILNNDKTIAGLTVGISTTVSPLNIPAIVNQ